MPDKNDFSTIDPNKQGRLSYNYPMDLDLVTQDHGGAVASMLLLIPV